MNLSEMEDALVAFLKTSTKIQVSSGRIVVSGRTRDEKVAQLADGGLIVAYGGSQVVTRLGNGFALSRSPRFLVKVGAATNKELYDLMDGVIETLNGATVGGIVFTYDGDGPTRTYNSIEWFDVTFRTNAVMEME